MSGKWRSDGVVPQVVKVSVPRTDSGAGQELFGDFLVRLQRRSRDRLVWLVEFEDPAGTAQAVLIVEDTGSGPRLRFQILMPAGGGPVWEQTDPGSLRTEETARSIGLLPVSILDSAADSATVESASGWAETITLRSMAAAQAGTGNILIPKFGDGQQRSAAVPLMSPDGTVQSSGSPGCFTDFGYCDWCEHCTDDVCHFWVPDSFNVDLQGVLNDFCNQSPDCEAVVGVYHLFVLMAMPCAWQKSLQMDCGNGELTVGFFLNEDCELELRVHVNFGWGSGTDMDSVWWATVVDSGRCNDRQLLTAGLTLTQDSGAGTGGCREYPQSITVKGNSPDPQTEDLRCLLQCIHRRAVICPLKPRLWLGPAQKGLVTSCGPCGTGPVFGQGTFRIPGTFSGPEFCGGAADCVSWDINLENGNVSVHLSPPAGGAGVPGHTLTFNSSLCVYQQSSYFRQQIINMEDCHCDKVECDGSIIRHANKDPASGQYRNPLDRTDSTITQKGDGTFTELDRATGNMLDYDTGGDLVKVQNPAGQVWTVVNGVSGLERVIDPYNRRTTFTGGRIVDVYGRTTTTTSTSTSYTMITPELCESRIHFGDITTYGEIRSVVNPAGQATTFAYDTYRRVTSVTQPDGEEYTFDYGDVETTTVTDPQGGVTTVSHDLMREVTGITWATGGTQSFDYDSRDWLAGSVSPVGLRTTSTYANNLLKTEETAEGTTTYAYDGPRLISIENPLGQRTSYIRNPSGRLLAVEDPLNHRTTSVYGADGTVTATENPLGDRTTAVFDSVGQQVATINPLNQRTTYGYEDGQRTTTTTPVGAVSSARYDLNNRLLMQSNPLGHRTSFLYDTCATPLATVQPSGSRNTSIYSFGRLQATIDPLGNRTSFAYSDNGWRIRTESPQGQLTTTVHDAAGRAIANVAPSGLRTTNVLDAGGRAVATISPDGLRTSTVFDDCCNKPQATVQPNGARTTFAYNANGQQYRVTAPTGGISTNVYDAAGQVIASVDALGHRSSTVFDAAGQPMASIDPLNNRSTNIYNAAGQVIAGVDALGNRSTQVYDDAGRGVASIDARNNRWTTVLDLAGRNIASIDPLNRRTSSVYDVNGRVIASIDAEGNRSTTIFNAAGQTVATVDARDYRSTSTYNPNGQPVESINARGYRTTNVYDSYARSVGTIDARGNRHTSIYSSVGRVVASQNALGNRWTTIFNSVGQVAAQENPLGNRTSSIYDSAGRVIASVNPLGNRNTTVFNIASQTIASIDPNNHRTTQLYDAVGRGLAEINALGYRTTTVFDAVGQRTALVDARSNRHSSTYDATGNQTQQIDPLNRRTTCGYDAASQQTLRIDARSNRTSFVFDDNGQLTIRKYPDASRATFAYDETGNRTLMANATGRYTSVFSGTGQQTVVAQPHNQRMTCAYDEIDQRRSMDATGSGRFTYQYDATGQIMSLQNPFSERTTFGYDDAGRRTTQRNANGTRTSLAYDAANQQTQIHHRKSDGTSLLQLDYEYDNAGNRTVLAEDGSAARTTWSYDADNQLLGEHRTGTHAYRQTFTFDPAGNRTLKNADGTRTSFAYDNANQLIYGQTGSDRTTFTFDADGNQHIEQPATGNRTTTTWNFENQPTQYLLPTGSPVTMAYNPDNRRVSKQQGTDVTKFVWDEPIDAYLSELDSGNTVQAVYTNEPFQYGRIISQRQGSNSHWYQSDALGSTRVLTNSNQTESDTYLYDAWGVPISSTGTTVNPIRWVGTSGYYYDPETGLVYVRDRLYRPPQALWVSVDPIYATGPASPYVYAANQPPSHKDPSGLITVGPTLEKRAGPCGEFRWEEQYQMGSSEQDGILLQKVCVQIQSTTCPYALRCTQVGGGALNNNACEGWSFNDEGKGQFNHNFCYWEYWRIVKGEHHNIAFRSRTPRRNGKPIIDTFGFNGCDNPRTQCQSGTLVQEGEMYFIQESDIPRRAPRDEVNLRSLLDKFGVNRRGVGWAFRLYSVCAEDVPTLEAELKKLDTPAGPLIKKKATGNWDCCAACPDENTCSVEDTNLTVSSIVQREGMEPKPGN